MEKEPQYNIPVKFGVEHEEEVVMKNRAEPPEIFELGPDMWEKYKALRLRSVETDPVAWGESAIKEKEGQDESYWRSKLENPDFKMFGIEQDGQMVAMAGLQKKSDGRFFFRRLYVGPEMRGKGLAKVLFDKLFQEAEALGAKKIYLGVTEGIPALDWYKRLGFRQTEKHSDAKRGDGSNRDEILMEKDL